MKVLALEREVPGTDPGAFGPWLALEAQALWELQMAGIVREAYFDAEAHTAVLVLEAPDGAEAQRHLASLPLVRQGLITFEVCTLVPYDGTARLFAQS